MKTGRPKALVAISSEERKQLTALSASRSLSAGLVARVRIALMASDGLSNNAIGEKLASALGPSASGGRGTWRWDCLACTMNCVRADRARSRTTAWPRWSEGRSRRGPRRPPIGACARWQEKATSPPPPCIEFGGPSACNRTVGVISNSPTILFVEKVREIVGLYLNPPDKALVLCVDEKSQIQALDRTQPLLPMGLGYAEGVTHDYVRHGTTTLFAALDIASGAVLGQCKARHRHREYLQFLHHIDANVPADLDIHLVVDNYATHKHPAVKRWLAMHPRFQVHYTPTYSSWLNQVENLVQPHHSARHPTGHLPQRQRTRAEN